MTVLPAIYLEEGTYHARNLRGFFGGFALGAEGVMNRAALKVHQDDSPTMRVIVDAGPALIEGDLAADQGFYGLINDGELEVDIEVADPDDGRIDLIVARVEDTEHGDSIDDTRIYAIAGVPASGPVPPAVPATAIGLAWVSVGAGALSIVDANIIDIREPWRPHFGTRVTREDSASWGVSANDGTWARTQLDTETYDDHAAFLLATTTYTAPKDGRYDFSQTLEAEGTTTGTVGTFQGRMVKNGGAHYDGPTGVIAGTDNRVVTHHEPGIELLAGDTITFQARHDHTVGDIHFLASRITARYAGL